MEDKKYFTMHSYKEEYWFTATYDDDVTVQKKVSYKNETLSVMSLVLV